MICQFCSGDIGQAGTGHKPWCPIARPDDVQWTYAEDRPIALSIEDDWPCPRCGRVVNVTQLHRCEVSQ